MARYVIDAFTLLHLADEEIEVHPNHQLLGPNSIRSEALGILLGDVVSFKREEEAALKTHARLTEIKMRLLGDRVSRVNAWKIARGQGWDHLRDAEYLAITRLQADALVTVDHGLASKAAMLVPVAPFEALLRADP